MSIIFFVCSIIDILLHWKNLRILYIVFNNLNKICYIGENEYKNVYTVITTNKRLISIEYDIYRNMLFIAEYSDLNMVLGVFNLIQYKRSSHLRPNIFISVMDIYGKYIISSILRNRKLSQKRKISTNKYNIELDDIYKSKKRMFKISQILK